ncbi:hypothetical protein GWI33_012555 [Rhynchophorus ferrugineus]|uniref:Transposable element P transposase-like RNase H domain-containing protein n=1 Tax=Rhynchophorus ferrugineus TaxID=354439 RepID=A0A834MAT0_RHYFE|nr:hypothetical protein GWI33_012555 [Rhynchophorus ferrugineus]
MRMETECKRLETTTCYTFTSCPIKTIDLKNLIKKVIIKCEECGLNVVATVCDQGSANVAAIRSLSDVRNFRQTART